MSVICTAGVTSLFLDYALIDFGVGDLPGSISLAHYAESGKRITGNAGFNGSVNGNPRLCRTSSTRK